ncbi:MAG: endolytic transglycosylase MltG [Desulfobacteraceae bacterium]|nr:MAG: endolytic transglycosylase MltG [Desulfobacteraceae bacterium]
MQNGKKDHEKHTGEPSFKMWLWTAVVLAAAVFFSFLYLYVDLVRFADTPTAAGAREKAFIVFPGEGFRNVAENLVEAGLLEHPIKLRAYARLKKYDKKVKAGEYLLSASMSPDAILQVLASGKVRLHKVTVPEGYTLVQIAHVMKESGLSTAEEFTRLATNPQFVRSRGIDADSAEGYLFPETYLFPLSITPDEIISTMVGHFWRQFKPEWKRKAELLGFSIHEVVTLASMIEKETGVPAERPIVSSVFHNRLSKGMRLESDPTVIYGIAGFDGNLTRMHLKAPTPYNTYSIQGLPPGPISNPGSAAIECALFPAETEFLYFVARQDRTHHFSSSLPEHNQAVRKYQLGK